MVKWVIKREERVVRGIKREERVVRSECWGVLDGGLAGAGLCAWERGRPARNAALARGDTLILTFSHKGRRDPLASIRT